MSIISDSEFNDYGGLLKKANQPSSAPMPYTKGTRTSFGARTAWTRSPGMGISKQASGSFLSFDDDNQTTLPASDKGVKRN